MKSLGFPFCQRHQQYQLYRSARQESLGKREQSRSTVGTSVVLPLRIPDIGLDNRCVVAFKTPLDHRINSALGRVRSGKWEVGSGGWEVGSGKCEVEGGKWEVESAKWKVRSGKWEVGSGNPESTIHNAQFGI